MALPELDSYPPLQGVYTGMITPLLVLVTNCDQPSFKLFHTMYQAQDCLSKVPHHLEQRLTLLHALDSNSVPTWFIPRQNHHQHIIELIPHIHKVAAEINSIRRGLRQLVWENTIFVPRWDEDMKIGLLSGPDVRAILDVLEERDMDCRLMITEDMMAMHRTGLPYKRPEIKYVAAFPGD